MDTSVHKTACKPRHIRGFVLEGFVSTIKNTISVGQAPILSRFKQQIKNGQFIFAYHRALRQVTSAQPLHRNPSSSLQNKWSILWSFNCSKNNYNGKVYSIKPISNAGKLASSAVFQKHMNVLILCSPISHQINRLFMCKLSEKGRAKLGLPRYASGFPLITSFAFDQEIIMFLLVCTQSAPESRFLCLCTSAPDCSFQIKGVSVQLSQAMS